MASGEGQPLRVCLVAPVPPPYGGVANWTALVTRNAATDSRLVIDVIDTAPRRRSADGRGWGDRVVRQGLGMLRCAEHVRRLARTGATDVIHVTTAGQLGLLRDLLVLAIARHAGVPTVLHIRFGRVPAIAAANTREWRLMCVVLRTASLVMAIDRATEATIAARLPHARVVRVPNPVDLDALPEPADGDDRSVVFLGWLTPSKGMEDLLAAWGVVWPDHTSWLLRIVGPGEPGYVADLRARAVACDFRGELPHDDAMRVLGASAALVLPSHTEGCPNVVLEAMALSRAIVASRVGAIPELLDGGCGVLVDPHDRAGLAAALAHVMGDAALRRHMGEAARCRVEARHAIGVVMEEYLRIWRTLAEGRRQPWESWRAESSAHGHSR